MYRPRFEKVCGVTAWIPFTEWNGEPFPYFIREGCPKAFVNESACQMFCDYLNCMNP